MCQSILLWLWLVTFVDSITEEQQYCSVRYRRLCQGKGRHIACQFPDRGPGPSCERYAHIKFTNDLKHFITHYLNRRRQRIAAGNERVRGGVHLPKPQIMMLVEWDRELAFLAQRLADQCHFVHDNCRATVRYPYAGQTVGEVRWRRSSDSDELSAQRAIRRVLDAWWGERRRVQASQLTEPFRLTSKGTVWGHFSQLAVWNLQAVGCGAVRHGVRRPRLLLVCDFSHTNMLGQRTIVPGGLAQCPLHTARRQKAAYPLLCGPVRHPAPSDREELEPKDQYEEEEDPESDIDSVEVADLPTPGLWRKRIDEVFEPKVNEPREKEGKEREHDSTYYKDLISHKSMEKLNQDIESRLTMENKGGLRFQKPFSYGQWRENQENPSNIAEVIPLSREREPVHDPAHYSNERPKLQLKVPKPRFEGPSDEREHPKSAEMFDGYRPSSSKTDIAEHDTLYRQRWKQVRVRPPRPGANALYMQTTGKSKKPFFKAIDLDKEDVDQLFRDTGYSLDWKKT